MKGESLKNLIREFLKSEYPRVVHKGEIGRKAVNEWGYENENAGRRCRELEDEGIIKKIPDEAGRAMYQYICIEPIRVMDKPKQDALFSVRRF